MSTPENIYTGLSIDAPTNGWGSVSVSRGKADFGFCERVLIEGSICRSCHAYYRSKEWERDVIDDHFGQDRQRKTASN